MSIIISLVVCTANNKRYVKREEKREKLFPFSCLLMEQQPGVAVVRHGDNYTGITGLMDEHTVPLQKSTTV